MTVESKDQVAIATFMVLDSSCCNFARIVIIREVVNFERGLKATVCQRHSLTIGLHGRIRISPKTIVTAALDKTVVTSIENGSHVVCAIDVAIVSRGLTGPLLAKGERNYVLTVMTVAPIVVVIADSQRVQRTIVEVRSTTIGNAKQAQLSQRPSITTALSLQAFVILLEMLRNILTKENVQTT